MKPFELRCRLKAPVSLNHPWLHLDGVVAHLIQLAVRGRDYYTLPTKRVEKSGDQGRYQHVLRRTGDLVHASVGKFEPEAQIGSISYFKRFEADGFPARKKISRGTGYFREWALRTVFASAQYCIFYGVGDMELLGELLEHLTHLGNDTRIGWGELAGWELREIGEDRSIVWAGRAMRPIPVWHLKRYSELVPLAYKPPYWSAESIALCAPPGAEVELK